MKLIKLAKFALVGGIGFVVDSVTFSIIYQNYELELLTVRIIAFILAVLTTWLGNRLFTFRDRTHIETITQMRRFFLSASLSALPNLLVFKVMSALLAETSWGVYIAFVAGVGVGMVSNFLLSDRWVFKASGT